MLNLNKGLEEDEELFVQIYSFIFRDIRTSFKTTMTVVDVKAISYIDILCNILSYSDKMKEIFVNLKEPGMVWIPNSNG